MGDSSLQAELRPPGRHQTHELRLQDRVPAVVYGRGREPQAIAVEARALQKTLQSAGSGLISLKLADQDPVKVLAREIQRDPIRRHFLHVDFQVVSLTEKLRLRVSVEQDGTAPVAQVPDAVLVRLLDEVEIECLPADIPNHLLADMSKLVTVDDAILAGDLRLPDGVRLVTDPSHVIFSVTFARAAEEEEAAEGIEPVSAEEVEVVARGKAARAGEEFED